MRQVFFFSTLVSQFVADFVRLFYVTKFQGFFGMADFDAIYEEEEENEQNSEENYVPAVPDPIVVRGAGNMTV